jgi:type III secretion protein D
VLSAAAAYAYTSQPDAASEALLARQAAEQARLAALPLRLPSEQLQAALRKRLGEIDLLSRVTLELELRNWTISGSLNEEEVERLQRMLRSFSERHVIDFPIQVRLGNPESMLPFRISQVMSGHDPSIITDDGRRLYVGDEYRGVRLAAVAGNQLRFTGKHNLDIVW